MINVLYISMVLPYQKVPHAGGQTFYYYIKNIQDDPEFCVSMIAKLLPHEKVDSRTLPNVKVYPIKNPVLSVKYPIRSFIDIISKINPFRYYGNTLRSSIYKQIEKKILELDNIPDVIILEFTEMLLFVKKIKKIFPEAKIIASEHDVSFLRYERRYQKEKNILKKIYFRIQYGTMKKNELNSIMKCDVVMPHNNKDKRILLKNSIPENKIYVLTPYFHQKKIKRNPNYKDIIYYGAMNRLENYESAIWFIENVMPFLNDIDCRFIIVGANPDKKLLQYRSDKIIVTGFVESVDVYFENCTCLVAPLLYGAGVKVKILEALAAGVPFLTNHIGVEGISVKPGVHYIHCETAEEYIDNIKKIFAKKIDLFKISGEEKKFIKYNYNLCDALNSYKILIEK